MSSAPELQPHFPLRAQPLPRGSPIGGRELYRHAVREFLRHEIGQGLRDRHRLARHSESQWDRASDNKWKVLPSIIRRRWEAESRRLWPRRGDDPSVRTEPMDVFCNADEIYYVRGRVRPRKTQKLDWPEEYIRERYQPVYDALGSTATITGGRPRSVKTASAPKTPSTHSNRGTASQGPANSNNDPGLPLLSLGKAPFINETYKIDHSRGWDPPRDTWLADLPMFYGAADNGLQWHAPSNAEERGDALNLHEAVRDGSSRGKWTWHKQLGQGTFGKAMLYRWADDQGNILGRVVVKRDLQQSQYEERRHFRSLRDAGVDSKYIVKYLGENARKKELGRTYLEFAPYGTLHDLYEYYEQHDVMIPEPFLWYLLRCLAEAAVALEDPVPPHKKAMFHFDLKPQNILLNHADVSATSHHWHQNYPVVQMADFGGVCEYPEPGEPDTAIRGGGTPHWMPWELLQQDDQLECNDYRTTTFPTYRPVPGIPGPKPALPVDHPCRSWTSIWQIGLVLYTGMRLPPHAQPETQPYVMPAQNPSIHTSLSAWLDECYKLVRHDFPRRHHRRNRDDSNLPIPAIDALAAHFCLPPTKTATATATATTATPPARPSKKQKKPTPSLDPAMDALPPPRIPAAQHRPIVVVIVVVSGLIPPPHRPLPALLPPPRRNRLPLPRAAPRRPPLPARPPRRGARRVRGGLREVVAVPAAAVVVVVVVAGRGEAEAEAAGVGRGQVSGWAGGVE
ncbi:serine threonine protein kinase [Diplodia corticola]|uniref:Serine threonine protein kinase n=1 Tax=Diplodia corticola TaxID=236234 RepID=A0A1J9RS73_9PEZI|nr:serine threonine protein kinase [Diplodia corticola]OJD35403.1 serine threonine protein kinase [Diplodia corticola]